MGKKSKRRQIKNHMLSLDSGCSQCVCGNGFAIENLHRQRIQDGMAIARTATIELERCDDYAKTCAQKNMHVIDQNLIGCNEIPRPRGIHTSSQSS